MKMLKEPNPYGDPELTGRLMQAGVDLDTLPQDVARAAFGDPEMVARIENGEAGIEGIRLKANKSADETPRKSRVFRGQDERIPLLTQFYQVATFYPKMWPEGDPNAEAVAAHSRFEIVSLLKNFGYSQPEDDIDLNFRRTVILMQEIQPYAKEIMRAAARGSGVKASTLSEFSQRYSDFVMPRLAIEVELLTSEHKKLVQQYEENEEYELLEGLVDPGTIWEVPAARASSTWPHLTRSPEALVPLSDLRWSVHAKTLPIFGILMNDILGVLLGKISLKPCAVCTCPFVITRKTQVYCSGLCQNRNRVRRWRASKGRTHQENGKDSERDAHLL